MDVILNRIGLEKVKEKVKKPLKGLKMPVTMDAPWSDIL